MQAKGPVSHATITEYSPTRSRIVDRASGNARSAPLVLEVWWDRRSGFDRVVVRVDGRDVQDPENEPLGLTCRVYRLRDGRISALPDRADVQAALAAAIRAGG